MRRSLHLLLMFVLILRGLAGTAMAAGVLPPLLPAGSQHAQAHGFHTSQVDVPEPIAHVHAPDTVDLAADANDAKGLKEGHAGHGARTAATSQCNGECLDSPAGPGHGHQSTACSACEICHSAMLDVVLPALPVIASVGSGSPLARVPFVSAPTALAIKPPIA